jgi:hypothetical protein
VRVRTDDEVYRVDAVWLGPPKATFPWRARYVAWGVGILVFLLVLTGERAVGFGFGFFTVAWAVIGTVVLTRLICSRISHERPLGAVFTMWTRELSTPRERSAGNGGAVSATKVHVRPTRPRPKSKRNQDQRREPPRTMQWAQQPPPQPQRPRRSGARQVRQGRPAQHYAQHAQDWAGQPSGTGRTGPARPRSKEVGGVRKQGRT